MTTSTTQPRTAWWRSPDDPNGPPTGVSNATTILFVVLGLSLCWNLFRAAGAVALATDPNSELSGYAAAVLFVLVALNVLYLYLTWKVRQGSRRAWATLLVVLGIHIVAMVAATLSLGESIGAGAVLIAVPLLAVVLLTVPGSSRRYFLGR